MNYWLKQITLMLLIYKTMEIKSKYSISQVLYFILDKEQNPMVVVSIWVRGVNSLQYECRDVSGNCKYYNEFELTETENILTKIK